ncbi:MAG TPA: fumarylacetoacetate hydrolase family protein [Casimicrobiaceae bacterium]|nr:fumarylacetoacetate hydrolase family protein [Casimicrobiaceae bacterium]
MKAGVVDRVLNAFDSGQQMAPISASDAAFDVGSAYRVLHDLHDRRRAAGWIPLGRKIGFTNRTIWTRYGVDRPMWSHVWDRTLVHADRGCAEVSLDHLMQPRIEPEMALGLRSPIASGDDEVAVLQSIAWMAPAFEIVQSPFPDWKFTSADCTAAFGLHGKLVVGEKRLLDAPDRAALVRSMSTFTVDLAKNGTPIERGTGANVLGSPLRALMHLRDLLATQPSSPPLAAGEIVTTGTLTDAWPVRPGETWTSRYEGIELSGIALTLRLGSIRA